MSESARGEGDAFGSPRLAERGAIHSLFLPTSAFISWKSGIQSTAISCLAMWPLGGAPLKVVFENGLGIDGKPMAGILDLTHIDRAILDRKLEGILEIYEKFVGDDPREVPMKIFPGHANTMGGDGSTTAKPPTSRGDFRGRRV